MNFETTRYPVRDPGHGRAARPARQRPAGLGRGGQHHVRAVPVQAGVPGLARRGAAGRRSPAGGAGDRHRQPRRGADTVDHRRGERRSRSSTPTAKPSPSCGAWTRSHRLMRGTKTMAYPEMTASDVVTMLVGRGRDHSRRDHPHHQHLSVALAGQREQLGVHPAAGGPRELRGLRRRPGLVQLLPHAHARGRPASRHVLRPARRRHAARHGQEPGAAASGRLVGRAGGGGHRHRVRPDPGRAGHRAVALGAVVLAEHRPGHPAPRGGGASSRPRHSSTPAFPWTTRGWP